MPTLNGKTIHDLSRVDAPLRGPAERLAAWQKVCTLELAKLHTQAEELAARIRAYTEGQADGELRLNAQLVAAGYDVDELVDVRGDVYRVADEGEGAIYVGAAVPDSEDDEVIADDVPEHRADYLASVAFNG